MLFSRTFLVLFCTFFFNDTATTEIYTLSLHDALPISRYVFKVQSEPSLDLLAHLKVRRFERFRVDLFGVAIDHDADADRKSTRLNSSHEWISYAVFCLKKKKKQIET